MGCCLRFRIWFGACPHCRHLVGANRRAPTPLDPRRADLTVAAANGQAVRRPAVVPRPAKRAKMRSHGHRAVPASVATASAETGMNPPARGIRVSAVRRSTGGSSTRRRAPAERRRRESVRTEPLGVHHLRRRRQRHPAHRPAEFRRPLQRRPVTMPTRARQARESPRRGSTRGPAVAPEHHARRSAAASFRHQ